MPHVTVVDDFRTSRGLGRAFAESVLEADCKVAATPRNVNDLEDFRQRYGNQVLPLALDVTDEAHAHAALDHNQNFWPVGRGDKSIEEFRAQIETTLFGVIIVTKAVPYFRD